MADKKPFTPPRPPSPPAPRDNTRIQERKQDHGRDINTIRDTLPPPPPPDKGKK